MADTKVSALTNASALGATDEFHIVQGGADRAASAQQMADFIIPLVTTRASAATVAAGPYETWLVLAANSSDISTPTLTTVMTITGVGVGRYAFDCRLVYQTTATTTGINVGVNHTGTTTQFIQQATFISTGGSAATKLASNADQATTLGMVEGEGNRTKDTAIGTSGNFIVGVDAANSDMLVQIAGHFVVSVTGSLQIKLGSESGVLTARAMQGSMLLLRKFS